MPNTGSGGLGRVDIFAITGATGSKTLTTTPLFSYTEVKGKGRTGHPVRKNTKINFEEYTDTAALETHLQAFMTAAAAASKTVGEVVLDDGRVLFGDAAAASNGLDFVAVAYETKHGTNVKVCIIVGNYTGATGDKKEAGYTANNYTIEITAIEVPETITLPSAIWNTSIVSTTGAPTTLVAASGGRLENMTSA